MRNWWALNRKGDSGERTTSNTIINKENLSQSKQWRHLGGVRV